MGDLAQLAEQIRDHPGQADTLMEAYLATHRTPQHTLTAVLGQLDRLSRLVCQAAEDIPPQYDAQVIRTRNAFQTAQHAVVNLLNTIRG